MARLLREETSDLRRGMLDDRAASRYPANAVASLVNARIKPDGTAERRLGTKRTHPTALVGTSAVNYGSVEYQDASGTRHIVTIFDGTAFHSTDSGATWTQLATGLRSDYYSFATMRVGSSIYLFAANGDTTIKRYDGTTWDTLPNAPSGVKYIAVFNNRLYAAGHNGVIVQASRIADPETWASPFGLTVTVGTHDGDDITALYQVGSQLLVFDRQATSYIGGFGEQDIVVAVGATGFSRSVGCSAFRTVVGVGENAVCWMSERGVEYYGGGEIRLISRGLQTFFDETVDYAQITDNPGVPSATYLERTLDYLLALPSTGNLRNNRILVMNLLQSGRGWLGAASIDEPQAEGDPAGEIFFSVNASGYVERDAGGVGFTRNAQGYMELAGAGDVVTPTVEDANGYLVSNVTEQMASTLFVAHNADTEHVIHSAGYDGFVRVETGNLDDVASDGTGGLTVPMTVVSRPFLFGRPSQQKRARVVYLGSIQDAEATFTVRLRVGGTTLSERTMTVPATAFNQQKRRKVLVHGVGDSPQIEIETTDNVRVALLALAAELLREPLG